MSQTDPVRGERILESYIAKTENPRVDVEELKESLAVLGNAGLPSTARAILAQTRHPQADVRAEAVMALRFIRIPEVEQRLVQIIESDVDLEVRLRVVDALVHAPVPDSFLPVAQRMISDVKKVPVLLREKAVDLFLHFELDEPHKTSLRNWILLASEREPEARVKSKLVSAAQELMSR
ncbi:HEAT repeat domain-containing protein [bacterium]|nr:HEAT repeat domain-containing protein [bacterium]